jgi:acetylornithine deacetylase
VFGETTCNIGVIRGGARANVIPAEAQADLQIRLATSAAPVKQLLQLAIAGRVQIEYFSDHDPVRLLALDEFAQCVPRFTTDIPYLSNWGTPLLLGPGSIFVAHTDHEYISKDELTAAVSLYARLATKLMALDRERDKENSSVSAG